MGSEKVLLYLKWTFKILCAALFVIVEVAQIFVLLLTDVVCCPLYFLDRPLYQWLFQRVTEVYMLEYPLMFYYYSGNRVVQTGDHMEINENALIISNHTYFFDFVSLMILAPKYGL